MPNSAESWVFSGRVQFTLMPVFPDGGVTNAKVADSAGIDQSKLQHQHRPFYTQPNTTATSVTIPIWRVYGATATLIELAVGSEAIAVGAATVTVDLQKSTGGGAFATVLTGILTLDTANTARVAEIAAITTAGAVAGDLFQLVITATAGGGTLPTGLFVFLTLKEDAA